MWAWFQLANVHPHWDRPASAAPADPPALPGLAQDWAFIKPTRLPAGSVKKAPMCRNKEHWPRNSCPVTFL